MEAESTKGGGGCTVEERERCTTKKKAWWMGRRSVVLCQGSLLCLSSSAGFSSLPLHLADEMPGGLLPPHCDTCLMIPCFLTLDAPPRHPFHPGGTSWRSMAATSPCMTTTYTGQHGQHHRRGDECDDKNASLAVTALATSHPHTNHLSAASCPAITHPPSLHGQHAPSVRA